MANKILCIINRKSGSKSVKRKKRAVERHLIKHYSDVEIIDVFDFCREMVEDFETFLLAGGDGTINHFLQYFANTRKHLGIIPLGSGNGLARALGVSMNPVSALEKMMKSPEYFACDLCKINDIYCASVASFGFEAEVIFRYENYRSRGLKGYIKAITKEIFRLKYRQFDMVIDENQPLKTRCITLGFSNSGQYGNGFHITPLSQLNDGKFEMYMIKKKGLISLALYGIHSFLRKKVPPNIMEIIPAKKCSIELKSDMRIQVDGEKCTIPQGTCTVSIIPNAIRFLR